MHWIWGILCQKFCNNMLINDKLDSHYDTISQYLVLLITIKISEQFTENQVCGHV